MSTAPAQIWKGSSFHIERSQGQMPGSLVFRFSGPFTARDMYAALTPAALKNLFETEPTPRDPAHVNIFDLTDVPYMDSCGLGLIVGHFVRCQNKGVQFAAAGVSPRVLQLFQMTKVDHLFPITSTVDQAAALSRNKSSN
ncbi:MAG TPA: STAS domain-containing protein [Terracidiphilus sp.]|jgi:anti-anti-sigma factor|nr:STAS domain-containing protein [Terracidiphilus sp.]